MPDNAAAVAAIPVPGGDLDAPRPILGLTVDLDTFGGEIQTHEEKNTTLGQLVKESKAGVILFTYPKASTPGCQFSRLPKLLVQYIDTSAQVQPKHAFSATPTLH